MTQFMHIASPSIRLYYDQTGVAPHSETTRVTYTVTANHFAVVQGGVAFIKRATAASTSGLVVAKLQLLIGGSQIVNLVVNVLYNNTVNSFAVEKLTVPIYARAGDIIRITTYDGSVGGTIDYSCYFLITEFL